MATWSKDQLRKIAEADDLHISPFREDGVTYGTPTWIWSVAVDDALYVRGYNGMKSRWYQAAAQITPAYAAPVRTTRPLRRFVESVRQFWILWCDSRSTSTGRTVIANDLTFPPTKSRRPWAKHRPTSSA